MMVVDAPVVCRRKPSGGERLFRPKCRHFEFERLQGPAVPEARSILENGSAFVAVRIVKDVVAAQSR